jgi:hypothetical protein
MHRTGIVDRHHPCAHDASRIHGYADEDAPATADNASSATLLGGPRRRLTGTTRNSTRLTGR